MGMLANAGSHHPSNPADDYRVQPWYSRPWTAVLRPTNKELAALSANMAIAAANNNNVIYIWGATTYHRQLEANNNDPAAIQVQCGTDCAGTVFANIKGACRRLGIDCSGIPDMGTSNVDALLKLGYQKFTDSDHINTDAHALRGDVYVNYSVHAAMHVGDGNLDGYETGSDSSSGSAGGSYVDLNVEAISPYVIKVPDTDKTFDANKFRNGQVCGVLLSAGYLYSKSAHLEMSSYISPNLASQTKCADEANMPYALLAEVRSRSVGEAQKECSKLYYVCAAHVPEMSLWLHLDFPSSNSKSTNNKILDYYYKECSKWGFKNTLGVYVDKDELKRVDWEKYSDKMFLWKVDHTLDVDKYVGVLPFAEYIPGTSTLPPSGTDDSTPGSVGEGGQEYNSANDKQQRIVQACKSTPSPGASLCAAWITYVYMNAGAGHPTGNADDMYYAYCKYSDRSQLKVGMLVAVPSHPGTSAGRIYGHVAIYIGDGKVMDNIGYIRTTSLDSWLAYYGKTHTPKWGFGASGIA